ncbi:hypothetical protein DPMN_085995 [Dreissena polymorpha]|uniref:Uncharacterized protein n=1 Tax=Dreissena polymorpha TaxID=45954 RepID=A0A9D3YH27_DREPO|nr:hypothetical protein DPMN_085995 [Dreissena polymorpha]
MGTPEVCFDITAQVFSVVGDAFGMVASRIKSLNTFVQKFSRFLARGALQQTYKLFSKLSLKVILHFYGTGNLMIPQNSQFRYYFTQFIGR